MTKLDYNVQKSEVRHHAECLDSHLSLICLAKNCKSIALVNFWAPRVNGQEAEGSIWIHNVPSCKKLQVYI